MAKRTTKLLGKETFLGGNKSLRKELCELPSLGGSVWVRALSGKSLLTYNERVQSYQKDGQINPVDAIDALSLLVSLCVVDEDGNLMFTEEDVAKLAENDLSVLDTIGKKALEVSGINTEAIEEVKSNLKNAQESASTAS